MIDGRRQHLLDVVFITNIWGNLNIKENNEEIRSVLLGQEGGEGDDWEEAKGNFL